MVEGFARYPATEHLAHNLCLLRHDLVAVVLVPAVAVAPHAVGLALQGVALHAAPCLSRHVQGEVGGLPLKYLLHEYALGAVRYVLERGLDLHALLLELLLVYRRVVLRPREALHHVHHDVIALWGVGYHLLELRAVIRPAAHGVVGIHANYLDALALAVVVANAQLVINRGLALLRA
ncbi:MAG: hypothetical protein UCH99_00890 [Adlercreutzia sp.]|nr:hypothetical protein [Adlercreutzia sp.]MEE0635673.1 hypothetical protein [Adlercreutzia sp.]